MVKRSNSALAKITGPGNEPQSAAVTQAASIDGDSALNIGLFMQARDYGFNDSTWDRWRNNHEVTIFTSAQRLEASSPFNSSDITNFNGEGFRSLLNITASAEIRKYLLLLLPPLALKLQ